jgi:ubiquitin-conjugating enzyme E2 J2
LKDILEVQDNNYYLRLCLSISDFHPDTWNPAWSVSTILTGLLSFMLETTPTAGSMESTDIAVSV